MVEQAPPREPVTRPRRVLVGEELRTHVSLWRTDEPNPTRHDAELIDISQNGTKLRVACCLRFEESVNLRIEIPGVGLHCYVVASVRHIRSAGDDRWIVGCSVDPPLNEQAIARVVTRAAVDRRRSPRQPVSLQVSVRRQLGSVDRDAQMLNLSAGGFCVRMTEPCEAGERLRMTVLDPSGKSSVVEARVQWQIATPQDFLTGCRFLTKDGFDLIRTALPGRKSVERLRGSWPPRRLFATLIAVLALGAAALLLGMTYQSVAWRTIERHAELSLDNGNSTDASSAARGEFSVAQAEPTEHSGAAEQSVTAVEKPAGPNPALQPSPAGASRAAAAKAGYLEKSILLRPPAGITPAMRQWTDDTGDFGVLAVLLEVGENVVRIRRDDGRDVTVPLERLSERDLAYVRETRPLLDSVY